MSRRTDQIDSLLRESIGEYLARNAEWPDGTFVTITKVSTAPDLKNASVYVSVLPEEKRGSALEKLRQIKSDIQKELFHSLSVKFVPKIHFKIDSIEARANEIDDLLDSIFENDK